MEPLKNIVSLFKDFENNILTEENFNNEIKDNNLIRDEKSNENNNLKIKVINEKNLDEKIDEAYHTTYNFKKPILYPINYYSFNQLKAKEKKYEKAHKLAFEEYQKKINLKDEKIWKNNRKNYELDEYEKQYFNKLFNKKIMTNKLAFMRECRIRDIIITNIRHMTIIPHDIAVSIIIFFIFSVLSCSFIFQKHAFWSMKTLSPAPSSSKHDHNDNCYNDDSCYCYDDPYKNIICISCSRSTGYYFKVSLNRAICVHESDGMSFCCKLIHILRLDLYICASGPCCILSSCYIHPVYLDTSKLSKVSIDAECHRVL